MQVKKQMLELDMEQRTVSKLWKEYVKGVYYHPAPLGQYRTGPTGINKQVSPGRKWKGTKEPLDEDKRGEWKS